MFNVYPLQAEKNEWMLTPKGSLVKSNAKKTHNDMDDDLVTDYQPAESYIFSNDKEMTIDKDFAKDIVYGLEYHKYEEGKSKDIPKELTFDRFLNKKENTIAEIVGNISKTYRVMDDRVHLTNPFIRRANDLNKETRSKPVEIAVGLNELLKPDTSNNPEYAQNVNQQEGMQENPEMQQQMMQQQPNMLQVNQQNQPNEMSVDAFKYGGKFVPKASWGNVLSGVASGAGAGMALGPWGAAAGALIGGVGSLIIGGEAKKKALQKQMEIDKLMGDIKQKQDSGYAANNMTTIAKAGIPLPNYRETDYTGIKEQAGSTFDRMLKDNAARRSGTENLILGANNSALRAYAGTGATSDQIANLANNGQVIDSINKNAQYYDERNDKTLLDRMQYINPFIQKELDDNQRFFNTREDQKYGRTMNTVGELGANYQDYNGKNIQRELDTYAMRESADRANAQETQNTMGQFNNTLTGIGSAYQGYQNAQLMKQLYGNKTVPGTLPSSTVIPSGSSIPSGTSNLPSGLLPDIKIPSINLQTPSFGIHPPGSQTGVSISNVGVIPTGQMHPSGLPIFKDALGRSFITDSSGNRKYI